MAGIPVALLLSQVRNTAPYLFDDPTTAAFETEPAEHLRSALASAPEIGGTAYFRVCLAAHYATCATPVPTDVDIAIRKRLWEGNISTRQALEMAQVVLDSRTWNLTALTNRASYGAVGSPLEHTVLHGHFGEWFTVAAGAYSALGAYRAAEAVQLRGVLLEAIEQETRRHVDVFRSAWRADDGLGGLRACVSIAHNFGDLDRVIDMWELPVTDTLRGSFYKLTHSPFTADKALRWDGVLWCAGELYKATIEGSSMAAENHRHFALRKPRCLRQSASRRIPIGPFFDAWGTTLAAELTPSEVSEVVDALVSATERSADWLSYARAVRAMAETRPEARGGLARLRKIPRLRATLAATPGSFEDSWATAALKDLEAIPSRASGAR